MRYRLDVVATSVVEVLRHAGGWMFDRAMAGWDVTVLIAGDEDDRPLQIVGAHTLDLEYALASVGQRPRPQTLAAAADLWCDQRTRQSVLAALGQGVNEVTLWGETPPAELDGSVAVVHHRLSAAAQVFKARALAAAHATAGAPIGASETFMSRAKTGPALGGVLLTSCSNIWKSDIQL